MTAPGTDRPSPDDAPLAAGEGVNEGSASATQEAPGGAESGQVLGDAPAPSHHADSEADPAPPEDVASDASREAAGPGQQLQAGEG